MQNRLTRPPGAELDIAIVGGGASGTLTAVQLLRGGTSADLPLHITLLDRDGRHGLGQAYATEHPAHLLNAMAGQMSAFPDDAEHLMRWAGVSATAFLPRRDYGSYLRHTLVEAARQAIGARLTRRTAEVVAIRRDGPGSAVRLVLADGDTLQADAVVLATGNVTGSLPFPAPASSRVIADPWAPGALAAISDGDPVVIVGTGLTMLDLAVSVTTARPDTVVHAVSRHALLPRPHPGTLSVRRQTWLPATSRSTGPVRLGELMWQVRAAIASNPAGWFEVVDSLRPYVPGLWRRMPERDRRLFLRHVARYWEVHRHLVPPVTMSRIATLRHTGRLAVRSGRITQVIEDDRGLLVHCESGGQASELRAGWLINGTGVTTDVTATASPLLQDLLASGMTRPDPFRLGVEADCNGAVLDAAGRPSEVLYSLGPPLRGVWYETTAIPEIRVQAATLARHLAAERGLTRRPGSAA
ncbi:MAG TPA: FAD/NAD(P)-binding protein [Streptosporangiaceae bacterium]